jgi:lysophospholipase L1-like esterase
MAESLSPLTYGTIVGRYVAIVADTPDETFSGGGADNNDLPDVAPLSATVTFVPTAPRVLVPLADAGPATVMLAPVIADLSFDGRLSVGGQRYVKLVATDDPNVTPRDFEYEVRFSNAFYNGTPIVIPSFIIKVPGGTTIDLTTVTPVQKTGGTYITQGPRGEKGEKGDPAAFDEGAREVVARIAEESVTELVADGLTDGRKLVTRDSTGAFEASAISSLGGALAPRFAPYSAARPGCRWVALGDSLTRGTVDDAPIAGKTNVSISDSWPGFAAMLSGQKLTLVKNAGITANTTAMMLARFDQDVTPYAPTLVTVGSGTNEFLMGVPFEVYRADFIKLIAKVRSIGAVPVIVSLLPNQTQRQRAATWVKWQRSYAAQQGIPFIDFWSLLIDPTTGILNGTAVTPDGTHPGVGGMIAMARYASKFLLDIVAPNAVPILTDNADTDSLLSNPLFLGGVNGAGVADGWLVEPAAPAGSFFGVAADPAFCLGNFQKIERNATTSDLVLHQGIGLVDGSGAPSNQKVAPGDRIITMLRFKSEIYYGSRSGSDTIRLKFGAGPVRDIYTGTAPLNDGVTIYHEDTVPANANQIDLSYVGGPGSGMAWLGQVSIINATRGGLVVGSAF